MIEPEGTMSLRLRLVPLLALAALLLVAPPTIAQNADDDEAEDDGIRQSVARLSWFEGEVSFNRGDDPDDWQFAAVNYPLTLGDRVWVAREARAELQMLGATAYLAPESELSVLDLQRDVRQLSLTWGTATFRIRRLDPGEVFEIATPNVSVTFETPGVYRIDVDDAGNSRIAVSQGRAFAAAAGGGVLLERGERMLVEGSERPEYDVVALGRADAWDRWVEMRARRYRTIRSAAWVHPDIYGLDDLDAYGSWEEVSGYGTLWYPKVSGADWAPYRSGRWIWRDPWGWTWLSYEPWGWAPYHHGRWVVVRGRWAWVPDGPHGRRPGYYPAIVGFVGGGPGWSISVSAGGFVGWFPLGPREPFHPWWYHSRRHDERADYRYAYRSRAVVVPRDAFVRGRWGDRDIVRDAGVLREISSAPVLRGPIPVLPTRDSIRPPRAAEGGRDPVAPPRQATRPVVARRTVPPAPPTFDRKLEVIRERGGEPIPVEESRRIGGDAPGGERPVAPVRPVTREGIALSPRADVAPSRHPSPLPTAEPRPAATNDRPTPRGGGDVPAIPPTSPARREESQPRRTGEARPANTPVPPEVYVPAPRPTRGLPPAPSPRPQRQVAPTPYAERFPARRDVVPPPAPRAAPVAEPRRVPTPEPERAAPPRGEVRSQPAEKPVAVPQKKAQPKPTEPEAPPTKAAPTKAAPRRVSPEPS